MPKKGKSLAEVNPKLAKQWHPTKNGELTPLDVSCGSHKKVWWKCGKGKEHDWEATIDKRSLGRNCPVCVGKKIVLSNCLATLDPRLSNEWHPTKNGNLTPFNISKNSNKKVWWKCSKGDDHEWESSVNNRRSRGCPVCSNRKIVLSNCLFTTHPKLSLEWHPKKNGNLTPYYITKGTHKKVWWKCPKGDDHEWEQSSRVRVSGVGCPICSGYKVVKSNCLATTHPELAKEWHPTKNRDLTPFNVVAGAKRKVWWKCSKGDDHEWETTLDSRKNKKSGCLICSSRKVVTSNCFAVVNPKLAKEWHPTRNGTLTPFDIPLNYSKKVWWKCPKGGDHEWETTPNKRVQSNAGCHICWGGKAVVSNCLSTLNPKLAKEWHPTKNGDLSPNDVVLFSNKKVWWKCIQGLDHEWISSISNRRTRGCPYCTLTPQSKQELTITFELIQFFRKINPKGFKTRVEGKLWSIDIYIPELNLGIEFDGSYWHKDKRQLDKLKTKQLQKEGFEIIRVRQKPLKRIFKTDVMAAKKFDGKKVTNDVLLQIMKMYKLEPKKIKKIEKYLEKDCLQNQKDLDKYIEQILTEKAENKNKKL